MDDDQRELVSVLQDASLPRGVPVLPTLDVAARFAVAGDPGESAGAWYDATLLPGGALALTVGQVPGTGVASAVAAGRVQAVLRAALLAGDDVGAALAAADLHVRHTSEAHGTAVVVAVVDADRGQVEYGAAGHEPPLLIAADGPVRLPRSEQGLLGTLAEPSGVRRPLAHGEQLLLTSPVSVPAGPFGEGPDAAASTDAVVSLAAREQHHGACVVVAARPRDRVVTDLRLEQVLGPDTVRDARHELGAWLEALGASTMDALALVHATAELVTNALDHAHPAGARFTRVEVTGCHEPDGRVRIEVADRGTWRGPTDDDSRGRGLAMASGLVDELTVTTGDDGTRAVLRHRLTRPVRVERARPDVAFLPTALDVDDDRHGAVRLTGAFGHDEVDQVTHALLLASRGGTRPLEVDLRDVTDLSAGAVRMLAELVEASSSEPPASGVVLHVGRGSVAHVELERAGVAFRAW